MAFDEGLASRVREALGDAGLTEKRMFGGVGFLLNGNMACGLINSDLIVRVGPAAYAEALAEPGARPFDITGRAMSGWVMVSPDGHDADHDLRAWVDRGVAFAATLPPK